MEILISSIVGGIIGLLIGVILEKSLLSAKEKAISKIRRIFYKKSFYQPTPTLFRLGSVDISWLVYDGDGEMEYRPDSIKCIVKQMPIPLPQEVIQLWHDIEKRENEKREKGYPYLWNGPLYALERATIGRSTHNEDMEVIFTFRPTDYYTFQATVMSLDKNLLQAPANLTLRQKYLKGHNFLEPIPFLANGFGVSLIIISKDKKLLLTVRTETTGIRPGELDVSVVEGIHPVRDQSAIDPGPDLYRTAIFGAREELGIELSKEAITFLGFGVDTEYYQWNIIGVATIYEKAIDALESRTRGTGGKWETKQIEIVDSDPQIIFKYLKNRKIWSTGLLTIYWTLVHEYGRKRVESIVKTIFRD